MTHRRSSQKAAAKDDWDRFVSSNQRVIAAAGLPEAFTPTALRAADRDNLAIRFGE